MSSEISVMIGKKWFPTVRDAERELGICTGGLRNRYNRAVRDNIIPTINNVPFVYNAVKPIVKKIYREKKHIIGEPLLRGHVTHMIH